MFNNRPSSFTCQICQHKYKRHSWVLDHNQMSRSRKKEDNSNLPLRIQWANGPGQLVHFQYKIEMDNCPMSIWRQHYENKQMINCLICIEFVNNEEGSALLVRSGNVLWCDGGRNGCCILSMVGRSALLWWHSLTAANGTFVLLIDHSSICKHSYWGFTRSTCICDCICSAQLLT